MKAYASLTGLANKQHLSFSRNCSLNVQQRSSQQSSVSLFEKGSLFTRCSILSSASSSSHRSFLEPYRRVAASANSLKHWNSIHEIDERDVELMGADMHTKQGSVQSLSRALLPRRSRPSLLDWHLHNKHHSFPSVLPGSKNSLLNLQLHSKHRAFASALWLASARNSLGFSLQKRASDKSSGYPYAYTGRTLGHLQSARASVYTQENGSSHAGLRHSNSVPLEISSICPEANVEPLDVELLEASPDTESARSSVSNFSCDSKPSSCSAAYITECSSQCSIFSQCSMFGCNAEAQEPFGDEVGQSIHALNVKRTSIPCFPLTSSRMPVTRSDSRVRELNSPALALDFPQLPTGYCGLLCPPPPGQLTEYQPLAKRCSFSSAGDGLPLMATPEIEVEVGGRSSEGVQWTNENQPVFVKAKCIDLSAIQEDAGEIVTRGRSRTCGEEDDKTCMNSAHKARLSLTPMHLHVQVVGY